MAEPERCSVGGCDREAYADCDLCQSPVCDQHNPATVCLELCPDCYARVRRESPEDYRIGRKAYAEEDEDPDESPTG